MNKARIIQNTIDFVKQTLKDAEGGHDYFHTERVYKNALLLSRGEHVDEFIVALGALLHDIADAKFYPDTSGGDETVGPRKARTFLESQSVDEAVISHVENIIRNISYKSGLRDDSAQSPDQKFRSKELDVIQDADRLDAIGAIGIARCFNYGGFKNRKLYDPEIAPNLNMSKSEYKKSTAPTINHFYEKLLLLKDSMNTKTGLEIAKARHEYMEGFLEQFYDEWHGKK